MTHDTKGLLKTKAPFQEEYNGKKGFITYEAHLRAYAIYSYHYGTAQTAHRLAERGGFGIAELNEFYPEWRNHIIP